MNLGTTNRGDDLTIWSLEPRVSLTRHRAAAFDLINRCVLGLSLSLISMWFRHAWLASRCVFGDHM